MNNKINGVSVSRSSIKADGITIEEIRSLDDLRPWAASWNALVQHRPMRSTTWLNQWWKLFGTRDLGTKRLRILLLTTGSELIGVAPFYTTRTAGRLTIRLLGDVGDICTDHTTCFAKLGLEVEVGKAIGNHLVQAKDWARLQLEAIDTDDLAMQSLLGQLESLGCLIHRTESASCWSIPVPETWDDYLSILSKSHRKRCRRLVRAFFDSGRVQLHSATPQNIDAIWEVFLQLHARRWGDRRRPAGAFSNRQFRQFHETVSRALLDQDRLRLACLTVDGRPVAAEYQFLDDETLYGYQSGMCAESGEFQPGNLSLIASMKFSIERGLTQLDLLRGNEPYKAHWRAAPMACQNVRVWANNILGRVEMQLNGAKDWVAEVVRTQH